MRLLPYVALSLLLTATLTVYSLNWEPPPIRLRRIMEISVMANSTVLVKLHSAPTTFSWHSFKDSFYNGNESYWHSSAIDRIVNMFNLSNYVFLGAGEDDARGLFTITISFVLNESGSYDSWSGILRFRDSFKLLGEFLYSVKVDSEKLIYNCTPRYGVRLSIWHYTNKVEWSNIESWNAPEEYELYFKIPVRIASNLPANVAYMIYLNSKPLIKTTGNNTVKIYGEYNDMISVDREIKGTEDTRYVYNGLDFWIDVVGERDFRFNYTREYRIIFQSNLIGESVSVNGSWFSIPCTLWFDENTTLTIGLKPEIIEGS
ncbi:MAG: hypothetical protein ACUVQY_11540, partial [Thermoproteota archaeon]